MRVCMISPHAPPDQAANALLPVMLGAGLSAHGVTTSLVIHRSSQAPRHESPLPAVVVPRRGRGPIARSPLGAVVAAAQIAYGARPSIEKADLTHLHGNGLIIEVGQLLATRASRPYVITLYGTDVWHHEPTKHARFRRVVLNAACRIFYSRALLEFGRNLGLAPEPSTVIYAPVPPHFRNVEADERRALRQELAAGDGPLLLTVKRLHPVAGHEDLLKAMPAVLRTRPDVRLWLAGDGELRPALEALTRELGIADRVRFLGVLDNDVLWKYGAAADLFVLPSRLESWGTVMLEALACGTPVVATDTAGGLEIQQYFGDDVDIVPRGEPAALAAAIDAALGRQRRTTPATRDRLAGEFSVAACASSYWRVYQAAVNRRV